MPAGHSAPRCCAANGTDSPTLNAYVDSGAVIGNGIGTPGSLTVLATATEGTNVNANAGTGGIVSFGGISATSTLQPSVNAYLVGNETVVLVHDLTVQAILNHAEGHTRATAYGGGVGPDRFGQRHGEHRTRRSPRSLAQVRWSRSAGT